MYAIEDPFLGLCMSGVVTLSGYKRTAVFVLKDYDCICTISVSVFHACSLVHRKQVGALQA